MGSQPPGAAAIRASVATRKVSAVEVCRSCLDRIAAADARLGAFLTVAGERALARAAQIDRTITAGDTRPLLGVPIAVKDNICTRGIRTTAGSRMLDRFVPPYDATVVQRLEQAGAVVIGKTNCDEFAMGSSTEHSAFGPTRNPWDPDRTPGGSSGGSAVAVASGMVPVALGSDTGGSIRQPAAFCGIVGLKPSYGRVSRFGLIAFASSLDQVGPFARTARDTALVLGAIAGADPSDQTTSLEPVPEYMRELSADIRGLRIGVLREALEDGIDAGVGRRVREALDVLRTRGAVLIDIGLPHARVGVPVYYLVATAEASSNLARYDGVRYGFRALDAGAGEARASAGGADDDRTPLRRMYEATRTAGFGAEVKRRIMLGTYVLSAGYYDAYYLKAQQVRTLIRQDFEDAFSRVDVVAMPTSPTPPFKLGERVHHPLQMYLADTLTVGASLAGLPAISVPCGDVDGPLPVGLQLVGRMFDELTLLRTAEAFERETAWWTAEPPD